MGELVCKDLLVEQYPIVIDFRSKMCYTNRAQILLLSAYSTLTSISWELPDRDELEMSPNAALSIRA